MLNYFLQCIYSSVRTIEEFIQKRKEEKLLRQPTAEKRVRTEESRDPALRQDNPRRSNVGRAGRGDYLFNLRKKIFKIINLLKNVY